VGFEGDSRGSLRPFDKRLFAPNTEVFGANIELAKPF